MSTSRALINRFLQVLIVGLVPFVVTMNAGAQATDRTIQLEKEIEGIKQRLNKLESAQGTSISDPKPVASATGSSWRSLANWRQLKKDMSPADVRTLLGEPTRIDGGGVARWYYQNAGRLVFMEEKLFQWQEP